MVVVFLYINIIVFAFCQQNCEIKGINFYETSGKRSSAVTILYIILLLFVIDAKF